MAIFITFEGIEGCGKTTQIRRLKDHLDQRGRACLLTREPGGSNIGQKIRAILLDPAHENMSPLCELLLYAADRAQHCEEVLRPALQEGKIVLCDRYLDATAAYQEGGHGLSPSLIAELNTLAIQGLKPDLTILVDCPAEVGLGRARERNRVTHDTQDRFERIELDFHQRVRARYLKIAQEEPQRFIVVDGTQSIEAVEKEIWDSLESRWDKK